MEILEFKLDVIEYYIIQIRISNSDFTTEFTTDIRYRVESYANPYFQATFQ